MYASQASRWASREFEILLQTGGGAFPGINSTAFHGFGIGEFVFFIPLPFIDQNPGAAGSN